jgi:excisionase family DNA binding protein
MTQNGELLTIKQIAKELEVDEKTVRRWIKTGELNAQLDVVGRYRISRPDLNDFIARRTHRRGND